MTPWSTYMRAWVVGKPRTTLSVSMHQCGPRQILYHIQKRLVDNNIKIWIVQRTLMKILFKQTFFFSTNSFCLWGARVSEGVKNRVAGSTPSDHLGVVGRKKQRWTHKWWKMGSRGYKLKLARGWRFFPVRTLYSSTYSQGRRTTRAIQATKHNACTMYNKDK